MFPSFVLALREGLEAALIIGIVFGALRKFKREEFKPTVWQGVLSAAAVSLIAALVLNWIGAEFEGRAEQIFEGVAMLLAAGILTWMIFWMNGQSRYLKKEIETNVQLATLQRGKRALFALAFLAVVREGLELALFLTAAGFASGGLPTLLGATAGLAGAAVLGWLLFYSTRRLNLRRFFLVTNILLILFAAGLVAHGVHEFNEAGIIPAVVEHVWDINFILPESSTFGALLTALLGYNANPSLTEVIAYVGYFVMILLGLKLATRPGLTPVSAD